MNCLRKSAKLGLLAAFWASWANILAMLTLGWACCCCRYWAGTYCFPGAAAVGAVANGEPPGLEAAAGG